jgi:MFS family permease
MKAGSLKRAQTTALLKNRSFCRLWAAQFTTLTVVYGLGLASAVLVEDRTHSSVQTGLVILSAILPSFLASLISGAVVDRFGRKRVLIASQLARALVALAFWGGSKFLPPGLALATALGVNFAGAIFTQFATPAELSLLPELVEREQLLSANALFQLSSLAGEGLGIIVLSPLIIKLLGVQAVGLMGAILCLTAIIVVAPLPADQPVARQPGDHRASESVWVALRADLKDGWLTISRDRLLSLVAIQATLAATLLLVLLSLVPGLLSRHMGLGVEDAPLLMLPGGLGFVLGALLMTRWEKRLSRPIWIAIGLAGLGTCLCFLSLSSRKAEHLWLVLLPILGVGIALALVIIPARVILQERPPAAMRGRVIAAQLALANAAAIVPLLIGGSLADHLGIQPVMGLLGLMAMGAGVIGLRVAWG